MSFPEFSAENFLRNPALVDKVWKAKTGSCRTKSVLVALAQLADAVGECVVASEILERMTGLSRTSVLKSIADLKRDRFIKYRQQRRAPPRYRILGRALA